MTDPAQPVPGRERKRGKREREERVRGWMAGMLPTLRLRLVVVFALVALTAAVSASGIAYWLNRDAVLTRTQNAALNDFRKSMEDNAGSLPRRYDCRQLRDAAEKMSNSSQNYEVLLTGEDSDGVRCAVASDPSVFTMGDIPERLRKAVAERRPVDDGNAHPYHLYWQRTSEDGGNEPFLVGGAKMIGDGPTPTGYMRKSLAQEREDLSSLAWSLGIATGLALIGAMLLAQAAATTVLRPLRRLGDAARRLGEGKLDTRLKVSGTDELAELSRTFNRTAESLEHRVADLSAREESSRRFVADMSHELRTPMTAISAVTEVLEEEQENLDPMIAPAVQLVVSETRRLNDLVENLMEVTRFDAGTAKVVLDDVDVADQVTACIDTRAWLDAVELDADRGLMARVDPRRLDVILANLIGNGLKHGGPPVRVSVRTREPSGEGPGELLIEVADRGPGIPEEMLPHVFDRFFKASASRPRSEGSGLGLSIAQENAHIHGGSISVRNDEEHGGAVFTLRLPRRPAEPPRQDGDGEKKGEGKGARGGPDGGTDRGTDGRRGADAPEANGRGSGAPEAVGPRADGEPPGDDGESGGTGPGPQDAGPQNAGPQNAGPQDAAAPGPDRPATDSPGTDSPGTDGSDGEPEPDSPDPNSPHADSPEADSRLQGGERDFGESGGPAAGGAPEEDEPHEGGTRGDREPPGSGPGGDARHGDGDADGRQEEDR